MAREVYYLLKDEIKDFMTFCEDYLYLPNIEVDTVSDKYDFDDYEG